MLHAHISSLCSCLCTRQDGSSKLAGAESGKQTLHRGRWAMLRAHMEKPLLMHEHHPGERQQARLDGWCRGWGQHAFSVGAPGGRVAGGRPGLGSQGEPDSHPHSDALLPPEPRYSPIPLSPMGRRRSVPEPDRAPGEDDECGPWTRPITARAPGEDDER